MYTNNPEHTSIRWEYNPVSRNFSLRCPKCGHILERLTIAEAKALRPSIPAIANYLKKEGLVNE